jgi:hypothetical protein
MHGSYCCPLDLGNFPILPTAFQFLQFKLIIFCQNFQARQHMFQTTHKSAEGELRGDLRNEGRTGV